MLRTTKKVLASKTTNRVCSKQIVFFLLFFDFGC
jgi:hypothetical protein